MDERLKQNLVSAGVRLVRVLWCDSANLIRAKAVHTGALDRFAKSGIGIAQAQMAVPVMYDAVVPATGLTPVGEVRLVPDWDTLTILPYAGSHARVMGDMVLDGRPWDVCPRELVRRMRGRAQALGLRVQAAFENEFYLLGQAAPTPADNTLFGATYAMDVHRAFIDALVDALIAQEMQVQIYHPESGPGQHEVSILHEEPLRAADNQVAFRETVRAVAHAFGLRASFLPKILEDRAGSGCHIHMSLWRGDENVMGDPTRRAWLSQEGEAFMAGVLAHLPALMAVTTPSTNSYRRLRPHLWSGAYRCWGVDNREAALRLPSSPYGPPDNFELKTVDASSNPYLAMGVVIAAGLDGIERGLTLPEPVDTDPGSCSDDERRRRGIERLPASLGEALAAFRDDALLKDAMGPALHRAFLGVREAEWAEMGELALSDEVHLLLDRY